MLLLEMTLVKMLIMVVSCPAYVQLKFADRTQAYIAFVITEFHGINYAT